MTHPNPQELLDFVYEELPPNRQAELSAHLAACDACQARVTAWGGVRRELAGWELPEASSRPVTDAARSPRPWPVVRWAAAAAVLIGTGFGLARLSSPHPEVASAPEPSIDVPALRAELAGEIRRELHDELRAALRSELAAELSAQQAKFAADEAGRRGAFEQAMARALNDSEVRQVAEHRALRRDVETLAIRAREELDQLAVSAEPGVDFPQEQ
jgi:hypothetical protein